MKQLKEDSNYANEILNMKKIIDKSLKSLSPAESLSLLYQLKLSRNGYQVLRNATKVFPSKHKIIAEKRACFPDGYEQIVKIDEQSALLPLKPALKKTVERILKSIEVESLEGRKVQLIFSTGFDGAGCQTVYAQKTTDDSNIFKSDTHLFATTFVPLRLVDEESQEIIWKNPASMSTRFCRTIHLQYKKETAALIQEEYQRLSKEIEELGIVTLAGGNISFDGYICQLDLKCLNAVYDNKNTHACPICLKSTKDFNKAIDFPVVSEARLRHGAGVLHTKIRTMEALVKVAERLELRKYRCSKDQVEERKREIQRDLWQSIGVRFGVVTQGFGTSNTGNTARKFFERPKTIAMVLKLPYEVVRRLAVVMVAISCQLPLNDHNFRNYLLETRKAWCEEFHWYPMSPTIHKILAHGADIAFASSVTLGQFHHTCNFFLFSVLSDKYMFRFVSVCL